MQVNNSTNLYAYTTQTQDNTAQKPTQEQLDKTRETVVDVVGYRSKKAQIDAYVSGMKQANENYQDLQNTQEYTQNYTDFASDVRRAENYATYLNNAREPSDLINRPEQPSIQPITNPDDITQDKADTPGQSIAGIAGYKSTQDQIDAYKSGSQQSESSKGTYQKTQEYVTNYNEFANQARQSEYINTYIENSKLFA